MALPDYIPAWRKNLPDICPEAATYIDDLKDSVERYRAWVIKQNKKITELRTKNNDLKIALEDARGLQIETESYIYEACGCEEQKPF